ncbi:MAG: hypothetical protein ACRDQ5_21290 [Sciscionella sp.]
MSGPTAHYRRMEQAVSSDQLAPAVDARLALATGIVGQRLRTATGFAVLAEVAGLAAWLAADRGNNAVARRRYAEAVQHAERTHHPLLSTAEKMASRQRGEPLWPWVFAFDRAKTARYQAGALSRLGDLRAATAAFGAAVPALTAPKPRALAQLDQAQVLARAGRIGDGCALATEALRVGRDYGSERVTSRVRTFRASLPGRTREAATWTRALTALYEQQTW